MMMIIIIVISYDTVVTICPLYPKYVDQFFPALYLPALHDINSLLWCLFRMRNRRADFSLMYPLPSVELTLSFIYLSLNEVSAHKMLERD